MSENLIQLLKDFGNDFVIQDNSILINDIIYYFTKKNDANIYRGIFKGHHKFGYTIFHNVEIYNGSGFQHYVNSLSSPYIDKIYHL
jgi:hypothetical protein